MRMVRARVYSVKVSGLWISENDRVSALSRACRVSAMLLDEAAPCSEHQ
jgi:hypothetical protein